MRTREQVLADWERIRTLKELCYGYSIPPASAVEFRADRNRLALELEEIERAELAHSPTSIQA